MSINSLKVFYNSWPLLTLEDKITLLKNTEKKIESESVEKVAEFCLNVLSQISFENECNLYPSLNESVRNLGLRVQSRSTCLYFQQSTCSELEYVGYLVNKKNPYLLVGPGILRNSLAISESRNAFIALGQSCIQLDSTLSQETCVIILTLFKLTQAEQSKVLQDATSKECKEIIKAAVCFRVQGPLKGEIDKLTRVYLQNKKKKQLLKKIETFSGEDELGVIFKEFIELKENSNDSYPLLEAIKSYYSHQEYTHLNKAAHAMLSWYLLQTRQEVFCPHSLLEGNKSFCFAHYLLIKAECAKNPTDISLAIKKAYLNLRIHNKEDLVLTNLNEILFFYTHQEVEKILEAIESVLSFLPECESLRNNLVRIVQSIPRGKRESYTNQLLANNYYLSGCDPLFLFMLTEIEETGDGWEWTHWILTYGGVEYTIEFLNKLKDIHPGNILKFAKNLIFSANENEFEKEEDLLLFKYALSVTPDSEFLHMITKYMREVILPLKFDIQAFYPALELFFEKIKHLRGVHSFLYPLCEYAVQNKEFGLGIQIANWDKRVDVLSNVNPFSLDAVFFLAKRAEPEELADLYIKRSLDMAEFEPNFVGLLARSDCLVLCPEEFFSTIKKALLNLALRLCQDKNFSKVIELNRAIEASSEESILFTLLTHFTDFDEINYKKLLDLLFETHSADELVDLCLTSKRFNSFHKQLIETLLESIPVPLTNSVACHPIYKNAENASSLEIAYLLTTKQAARATYDEKIRFISFLQRTNSLVPSESEDFTPLQKATLAISERLWNDKHYDELITFIVYFESRNYFILRHFISIMSKKTIHDENFDRVFALLYKYKSEDFIISYLKECKNFTPYHRQIMNKIKACSVLTKQPF